MDSHFSSYLLQVLPSRASPIGDVNQNQINAAKQTILKPEEVLTQMANIVDNAPEFIYAITDMEPEKIKQMMPHLEELIRILKDNPLGTLIEYIKGLCDHHKELQQIKQVTQYIEQFVQDNADQAPITIKNKTKIKLVYAPQYVTQSKEVSPNDDFAKEIAGDKTRIAQETFKDLQKLKNNAKEAQDQLYQQILQGNEALLKQMKEAQDVTRQEMENAIKLMESEKDRAYEEMKKAVGWLHQQMDQQMGLLNAELEEKKKSYQTNVEELVSNIRTSVDKENQFIEKQMSGASEQLQQRLTNVHSELGNELAKNQAVMEEEVKKAAADIEAQVKEIREKMQAALEALKEDMQNVDTELKQSVMNAYNGAKKLAMDSKSQAEVEKTVADMKKATQDMREQMESEIRSAIQALSKEIRSILTDMRNPKNMADIVPAAPSANGNIQDSSVGKIAAQGTGALTQKVGALAQSAGGLAQGAAKDVINDNKSNGGAKTDATATKGSLEGQLNEISDDLDPNDLEFDEFDDDGDYLEEY